MALLYVDPLYVDADYVEGSELAILPPSPRAVEMPVLSREVEMPPLSREVEMPAVSREAELRENEAMTWEWNLDADEQLDFTFSITEELATIEALSGQTDAIASVVWTLPASLADNGCTVVDEGVNAAADKATVWLSAAGADSTQRTALKTLSPHAVKATVTTANDPPRIYQKSIALTIVDP